MKVLNYRIVKSSNKSEEGLLCEVVLLEDEIDNTLKQLYTRSGADNESAIGKAWNTYLTEKVGLVDDDVFYFMQSGEEQDEWALDDMILRKED